MKELTFDQRYAIVYALGMATGQITTCPSCRGAYHTFSGDQLTAAKEVLEILEPACMVNVYSNEEAAKIQLGISEVKEDA